MTRIALPCLALLLLAACRFSGSISGGEEGQYIGEIAIATFTPMPSPTMTVTPTPLPTFTPMPSVTPLPPPPLPTPSATAPSAYRIPSSSLIYAGDHVPPGSTVCLPPGTRRHLTIVGLQGTKESPIVVRNCEGRVIFEEPGYAGKMVVFQTMRFVRFLGNGQSARCGAAFLWAEQECGIVIRGGTSGITGFSVVSDIEIGYVQIGPTIASSAFAAGIKLHSNSGNNFYNAIIHHVAISGTSNEGIYLGLAVSDGLSPMIGASLRDSLIQNAGWNPIDWKQVTGPNEIAWNVLRNSGNAVEAGQGMGISLVSNGQTWIHDNLIEGMATEGIKTLNPLPGIRIERNRIADVNGFHILDRGLTVDTAVIDNALLSPGLGIDVRGIGSISGNTLDGAAARLFAFPLAERGLGIEERQAEGARRAR